MINQKINVKGTEIVIFRQRDDDYISLTDIARYKDSKSIEFDGFKNEAGSNSFSLAPKRWIAATNAIGLVSKSGRYGGTYAHKDIAFEFACRMVQLSIREWRSQFVTSIFDKIRISSLPDGRHAGK
ncbi:MAG: KilA-N domain-containing protein [Candidatus Saganbacteria bacterium]|nr:KilA-N domain-containing protein [Candidatus Saganbacteria bacterium]